MYFFFCCFDKNTLLGQLKGDGVYLARFQVPSQQNQGVRSSMHQSILHLKSKADNEWFYICQELDAAEYFISEVRSRQWIHAHYCSSAFAMLFQSRFSCLGNGAIYSGQNFLPQIVLSRHLARDWSTRWSLVVSQLPLIITHHKVKIPIRKNQESQECMHLEAWKSWN